MLSYILEYQGSQRFSVVAKALGICSFSIYLERSFETQNILQCHQICGHLTLFSDFMGTEFYKEGTYVKISHKNMCMYLHCHTHWNHFRNTCKKHFEAKMSFNHQKGTRFKPLLWKICGHWTQILYYFYLTHNWQMLWLNSSMEFSRLLPFSLHL